MASRFVFLSTPVRARTRVAFFIITARGIDRKSFDTFEEAQAEFKIAETILSAAADKFGHVFQKIELNSCMDESDREFEVELAKVINELKKRLQAES